MLQRDIPAEPHHVMQRRHHGHVEAQIELPKPDMGHSGEAAGVRPGLRGIKRARAVVPDLLGARDGPALFREQPIILIDADKFQRPHADALPHVHAVVVALQHLLLSLFAALAVKKASTGETIFKEKDLPSFLRTAVFPLHSTFAEVITDHCTD